MIVSLRQRSSRVALIKTLTMVGLAIGRLTTGATAMKRIHTAITMTAGTAFALGASLPLVAEVTIHEPYPDYPFQPNPGTFSGRPRADTAPENEKNGQGR